MDAPPDLFADLDQLLISSQPRANRLRIWQAGAVFIGMMLLGAWLGGHDQALGPAVNVISGLIFLGLFAAMFILTRATVRRNRDERQRLTDVEELVRLRRWPQAVVLLRSLLSSPMVSPVARTNALLLLTVVLNRYDRFEPAVELIDTIVDSEPIDAFTAAGLRLTRAMVLLREERLFDADRAIVELRRTIQRVTNDGLLTGPAATLTAGLTLVELYRDVKTGHGTEALELFNARLELLRTELSHRLAEAYVLAAQAANMLEQQDRAGEYFHNATLLMPLTELARKYPETAGLARHFAIAQLPKEAA